MGRYSALLEALPSTGGARPQPGSTSLITLTQPKVRTGLLAPPAAPATPRLARPTIKAQQVFNSSDGTILCSTYDDTLYIYQPDGSPLPAGKPVITSASWNSIAGLHLAG